MSATGLKERLIDRIREIDNEDILAEAYRLLATESDLEEPLKLNNAQKVAIDEAREQIKNGAYLTNNQADKEIEEWLNK
ncbi:hypothetical protein [Dyadobacter endophyticus]|uniref:Addiction module component n=1 Tax=Dyadobacter endophyticus TaxID=1749036 RepID=A0ABQ1ZD08_9BACT|nr:hypothetical protein [Dyadobacter endophyticus]GGH55293.1 hypothetical protein GCM10007423_62670 [Dyadobacter endophyticus]